jgi:hypothetical protein
MSAQPENLAGVSSVSCSGMTALVTGSTNGIGQAAALALGRLGAETIVHGRDEAAGADVVAAIREAGGQAQFVPADFTRVEQVDALADAVRDATGGLDLLINNAGGLFQDGDLTPLGVERTFHINHLSPYLLTARLLDHLREGARVVTTASAAHRGAVLDLEKVTREGAHAGMEAYSHSKLANVLFAAELARRLDAAGRRVCSTSVHPGFIPGSRFWRFIPGPLSSGFSLLRFLPGIASVADGAAELLYAGLAPETEDANGLYLSGQAPTAPSSAGRDAEAAERLWRRSADLLGIDEPLARAGEAAGGR